MVKTLSLLANIARNCTPITLHTPLVFITVCVADLYQQSNGWCTCKMIWLKNVRNNYVRPNSGFVEKLNAYFMHIRAFCMKNVVPGPWVCSF